MSTLRVTVEWLGGAYHAREWPPSPLRLYQAMLAGSAVHRRADPAFEAALRHLETLPAPAVTAPEVESETQVTASVPNNDGDRVLALHAKGRTDAARTLGPKLRTLRTRRTRRFSGAVSYDWTATAETAGHLQCLAAMARCVTSVGHGIDTALARAALIEHAAPAPGVRYAPDGLGRHRLDVPWPGAFDALERRYRAERGRIVGNAVSMVPEPARRAVRYRSALELTPLRCAAFALRASDDRPASFAGTRAMEVAAMVRHAVGRAARIAGLDERARSALMGHGDEAERLRVQPLPDVGHRRADGCIRRVMLTAAPGVDEAHWSDVVTRLLAAPLGREGETTPVAVLGPVAPTDPVLARFRAAARRWTTATPVVLPGHDHRRGRPRPHRTVRRLLRHAAIAEALVEAVAMEPAPAVHGSADAARYRVPAHLARYPRTHMTVRWAMPFTGPLALGAGTGYGLGLLVPAPR